MQKGNYADADVYAGSMRHLPFCPQFLAGRPSVSFGSIVKHFFREKFLTGIFKAFLGGTLFQQRNRLLAVGRVVVNQRDLLALEAPFFLLQRGLLAIFLLQSIRCALLGRDAPAARDVAILCIFALKI